MKTTLKISAILLTLFALITVFMSGSVIFDLFGIREKEGNYVLFIVIANFISGFIYLIAAYGLFFGRTWTTRLLVFATSILTISFVGLIWHISSGGIYEQQTLKAMLFRIAITAVFAGLSWRFTSAEKDYSLIKQK
ncbi:MAG: hypothetical protein QY309_07900 [Cyclobacteriaceae bacterium]|nr:MAG: hypothetical protein QY309_07900 [Cyclobacteriaceae bacterium]